MSLQSCGAFWGTKCNLWLGHTGRFVDYEWVEFCSISALLCEVGIREEPLEVGAGINAHHSA